MSNNTEYFRNTRLKEYHEEDAINALYTHMVQAAEYCNDLQDSGIDNDPLDEILVTVNGIQHAFYLGGPQMEGIFKFMEQICNENGYPIPWKTDKETEDAEPGDVSFDVMIPQELIKEARVAAVKKIMEEGIITKPLHFGKEREKAYGAMYRAEMVIDYLDMTLHFDMWHHHSSEECMTEDEVLENIDLKGLQIGDKYYDLYWYARWFNGKFFLHPTGWFGHEPESKQLEELVKKIESQWTEDYIEQLLAAGFKRIPELDSLK